jgi:hypothetical protein
MCEILRQYPLEISIYTLKNEGQEGKTASVQGWVLVGGSRT